MGVMVTLGTVLVGLLPEFSRAGAAFCAVLSMMFYVTTLFVQIPSEEVNAECHSKSEESKRAACVGADCTDNGTNDNGQTSEVGIRSSWSMRKLFDPLIFIFGNSSLRNLCFICLLVSMGETTLGDVSVQYAYD